MTARVGDGPDLAGDLARSPLPALLPEYLKGCWHHLGSALAGVSASSMFALYTTRAGLVSLCRDHHKYRLGKEPESKVADAIAGGRKTARRRCAERCQHCGRFPTSLLRWVHFVAPGRDLFGHMASRCYLRLRSGRQCLPRIRLIAISAPCATCINARRSIPVVCQLYSSAGARLQLPTVRMSPSGPAREGSERGRLSSDRRSCSCVHVAESCVVVSGWYSPQCVLRPKARTPATSNTFFLGVLLSRGAAYGAPSDRVHARSGATVDQRRYPP